MSSERPETHEPPHLLIEREGHVVTLVLNRPQVKNCFSTEMLVRLADAWEMIDRDDEVRAAILTGAGGTFCAGADLKRMGAGPGEARPAPPGEGGGALAEAPLIDEWGRRARAEPGLHWRALLRHHRLRKPLIAAVEGHAVGGGTEILQATDIRVAGAGARFGVTEARWGLFPLGGSTVRLRRQVPYTVAMEMLLTGRLVPAEEALRIGLVGRVVPEGEALAEARRIAAQIAQNGPLAVQAIKRAVQETEGMPEEAALQRELEIGQPIFATEDAREGPRAFGEKRAPRFRGR